MSHKRPRTPQQIPPARPRKALAGLWAYNLRVACGLIVLYGLAAYANMTLCLRHGMFASGYPGFMFRRSAWERIGGVNEAMRVASDFDFLFALARLGDFGFIDRPLYRKPIHGQNLANNSAPGFLEVMQSIRRAIEASPEWIDRPEVREALAWRVVETAWNVAAFGQLRVAYRILKRVRATFGWTFSRQLQTLAVPLLPAYRQVFMRNSRAGRDDVFASIEEESSRLLEQIRARHPLGEQKR